MPNSYLNSVDIMTITVYKHELQRISAMCLSVSPEAVSFMESRIFELEHPTPKTE